MEKSANYNFNLPNSANDEIADINDISDNFRIIDEKLAIDQTFSETSENPQSGTAVAEALSGYVSAEVGKGLSSNDYTDEEKEKLAGIEAGAEVNAPADTTYNPESANAQSGIAVAQAVDTCSPAIITTSDTGKAIAINDGSESVIKGLTAYGESVQDGTPTPDSPVEIVSVENPVISIYGKNFFDINGTQMYNNGVTVKIEGETLSVSGATTYKYVSIALPYMFPSGTTITLSAEMEASANNNTELYLYFYGSNNAVIQTGGTYTYLNASGSKTWTVPQHPAEAVGMTLLAYSNRGNSTTGTVTATYKNIQIEIGSTVTSYEPYTAQTLTVPYTFRGLKNASGDWAARDELKVGGGKVEIIRNCYSFLVDGTRADLFALNNTANVMGYEVTTESKPEIPDMKSQNRTCGMCSRFEPITNNRWADQIEGQGIVFGGNNQAIYLLNLIQELPMKDAFILYCAANPFEIVYWRDTPEIEDITSTEAGQALLALKMNYPVNSVISDIGLNITYRADTKNYIDNKIAALTALTLEG